MTSGAPSKTSVQHERYIRSATGRSRVLAMKQEWNGCQQPDAIEHPMDAGMSQRTRVQNPVRMPRLSVSFLSGTWNENNRDAGMQG